MLALTKTKPRRRLDQVLAALINALGGYKVVAARCDVTTDTVNKWKQNPADSGQTIPVIHLQTLLEMAGEQLTNLAAQNAADELAQEHFLNLFYRHAYPIEKVHQFIDMLQGQKLPERAVNE